MSNRTKQNASGGVIGACTRRDFVKTAGVIAATASSPAWGGATLADALGDFFQDHYKRMSDEEIADVLARLERKYAAQFGTEVAVKNTPPRA